MSKIADRVRAYVNSHYVVDRYDEWGILSRDQRLLIRELCDTCDMFERAADELSRTQVWIRVEDMLPDKQGHFLIVDKEGQMSTAFYTPRFGWFSHFRIKDITHWMPLPEAPKGGE